MVSYYARDTQTLVTSWSALSRRQPPAAPLRRATSSRLSSCAASTHANTALLQLFHQPDTARVLGRYYDCVVWRTYRQRDLEEFAELAGVP